MFAKHLQKLFEQLDESIKIRVDQKRLQGGLPQAHPIIVRIVGQMALLLSHLSIPIASTMDVDALYPPDYWFTNQLRDALEKQGLILENDAHLIWMPEDTKYHRFFRGDWLEVTVADPLYVMASKSKFHRQKDRVLLTQYFGAYPEARRQIETMGIDTRWVD